MLIQRHGFDKEEEKEEKKEDSLEPTLSKELIS